jgi:septum formation protein
LLAEAGLQFEVVAPAVEENASRALTVRELTIWNARRKAREVARAQRDAVVLGADTLVALAGEPIGKPADFDEARAILRLLSGREHDVCTGVFVCSDRGDRAVSFEVFTQVKFRRLSDAEITAYLVKINPLDKAGAYAAQGHGAEIIARIRGSYTNVVGLPIDETLAALAQFGVAPSNHAGGERWQISSLLPSGSSKKKA